MTSKEPYSASDLAEFLHAHSIANPGCSKQDISFATVKHFALEQHRKVYVGRNFAVRFSSAQKATFSNTVLSLSALKAFDDRPFIVCVVRPVHIELLLANSTFLKKISHTSHAFRADNIRGSFLGHDILRNYNGLENIPANFEKLFSYHQAFSWEENVERLAAATSQIVATGVLFSPSPVEIRNILSAPELARGLSMHKDYLEIESMLKQAVAEKKSEILEVAAGDIDNINYRGNRIEQLITGAGNFHGLGDLAFSLDLGATVVVDVKTKMLNLASSPKGYNIDKFLITLSSGRRAFSFFFVGIDLAAGQIRSRLVSALDTTILAASKVQFHWAGRNSRGVIQLSSDISIIFEQAFSENIELHKARDYLNGLINL